MAARSIFLQLFVLVGLGLAGCATKPSTCYVTLSSAGQPTAEACESGSVLMVRPITTTNAAYYVPPYVIGALSYEGFLEPHQSLGEAVLGEEGARPAEDLLGDPSASGEIPDEMSDMTGKVPLAGMSGEPGTPFDGGMVGRFLDQRSGASTTNAASPFAAVMAQTGSSEDVESVSSPEPVGAAASPARGLAPANRLVSPHPRIDGEVRYLRPFEGYESFPIASDLLL